MIELKHTTKLFDSFTALKAKIFIRIFYRFDYLHCSCNYWRTYRYCNTAYRQTRTNGIFKIHHIYRLCSNYRYDIVLFSDRSHSQLLRQFVWNNIKHASDKCNDSCFNISAFLYYYFKRFIRLIFKFTVFKSDIYIKSYRKRCLYHLFFW